MPLNVPLLLEDGSLFLRFFDTGPVPFAVQVRRVHPLHHAFLVTFHVLVLFISVGLSVRCPSSPAEALLDLLGALGVLEAQCLEPRFELVDGLHEAGAASHGADRLVGVVEGHLHPPDLAADLRYLLVLFVTR